MDLIIARENTEGFYADRNMYQGSGEFMPTQDMVLAIRKITRRSSEQIARQACELAAKRRGFLSIVHKANVMRVQPSSPPDSGVLGRTPRPPVRRGFFALAPLAN